MKKTILNLLVFSLFFSFAPSLGVAASAVPNVSGPAKTQTLTKKELRKKKRSEKVAKFIQKRIEKRLDKIEKKTGKRGFSDLDRNLQLAIIFAVGAIALSIIGYFLPFLWVLSGLAWLASVVFLILWIIEVA